MDGYSANDKYFDNIRHRCYSAFNVESHYKLQYVPMLKYTMNNIDLRRVLLCQVHYLYMKMEIYLNSRSTLFILILLVVKSRHVRPNHLQI